MATPPACGSSRRPTEGYRTCQLPSRWPRTASVSSSGLVPAPGVSSHCGSQTCAAATAWDGRPIISTLNTVQLWDRWEDLAQLPADQAIAGDFFASRFSVVGDQLLSAWHSTDTIEIFSLPDGEEVRTVVTEGQEGWIHGLSLSAAGELVTIHNRDEITIFDGETGVFLRSLAPIDNLSGLSCYPARR